MNDKSDAQLLREYVQEHSENAFTALVARYTDLVFSAALRQTVSPDLARDVAQSVFTDLARKAPSLIRTFDDNASLVGWLYRGARYASAKLLRSECRRQTRERQAMQTFDPAPESPSDWNGVQPVLDEAMADLADADRQAVLLRYFKNEDFQHIGRALGVSDDTAQKRVSRALDKLRTHLMRRGITISAASLAATLSSQAVQSAPSGLAAALASSSLVSAATGAASTLTLIKLMAVTKIKIAVVGAALTTGLVATLLVQHRALNEALADNAGLRQQVAQLADRGKVQAPAPRSAELNTNEQLELLRLRGEVGLLRQKAAEGKAAVDNARTIGARMVAEAQAQRLSEDTRKALAPIWISIRVFAQDNDWHCPTNFLDMKNELGLHQDSLDERTGNYDPQFGTNVFELVQQGGIFTNNLEAVVVRERQPRRLPDGRWAKAYARASGRVEEEISDTGVFQIDEPGR